VLLAVARAAAQQPDTSAITVGELEARLRFFSSDLFEGRYPGTRGETLTLEYLVSELQSFGVQPGVNGKWLQQVSILTHRPVRDAVPQVSLSGRITRVVEHGRDFRLANESSRADVSAGGEVVFVGYGISAPQYNWDDFAGVDLRGKVAVLLRGEPSMPADTVFFNGMRASRYSWYADKVAELERRGATGVLMLVRNARLSTAPVTGPRKLSGAGHHDGLAFSGNLTDSLLVSLLPPGSGSLDDLIARAAQPGFKALPLGVKLDVRFRTEPVMVNSNNVVGVIPGTDPTRASEHIVLSAHWDAYGIGRAVNGDSIYNGALDDGSGVTVLLALARWFAQHPQPRSLTFVFTTAEEWGLLGAQAFVCAGPLSLERMVANLNVDDGTEFFGVKRDVAPLGIELSTLGATVARVAGQMQLRVSPDPFPQEGFFLRADNYPFARAGIPALYMALGTDAVGQPSGWAVARVNEYLQRHYHRPSDDIATVATDLRGSQQFAEFIRRVAIDVARAEQRPNWLRGSEFSHRPTSEVRARCR
jgi:hypothetical protein